VVNNIGASNGNIDQLLIDNANTIHIGGDITANRVAISDFSGSSITFAGGIRGNTGVNNGYAKFSLTDTVSNAYDLAFTGSTNQFGGDTTSDLSFANTGSLTLGKAAGASFDLAGGLSATSASVVNLGATLNAAGAVTLADADTPLALIGNTTINTTSGNGAITLGNAVELATGATASLTLESGSGAISIAGGIGQKGALSALSINSLGGSGVASIGTDSTAGSIKAGSINLRGTTLKGSATLMADSISFSGNIGNAATDRSQSLTLLSLTNGDAIALGAGAGATDLSQIQGHFSEVVIGSANPTERGSVTIDGTGSAGTTANALRIYASDLTVSEGTLATSDGDLLIDVTGSITTQGVSGDAIAAANDLTLRFPGGSGTTLTFNRAVKGQSIALKQRNAADFAIGSATGSANETVLAGSSLSNLQVQGANGTLSIGGPGTYAATPGITPALTLNAAASVASITGPGVVRTSRNGVSTNRHEAHAHRKVSTSVISIASTGGSPRYQTHNATRKGKCHR
jgi:hypothetical protein